MNDSPQLASLALMIRADSKSLFVRHAGGPFGGLWTPPFVGVADVETAEDALERLMRDFLHVQPGPYEFLDTVYVTAPTGERFIANAFTCVDWQGEARFPASLFDDALWAAPADMTGLDLMPELRDWLVQVFRGEDSEPALADYTPDDLLTQLADGRGEFLAAFDAVPRHLRTTALTEEGWSALDVLAHTVDVEAYYRNESRRCLEQPGRTWRTFNDDEWKDLHALRPSEDETVLRERMDAVRGETRTWLQYQPPETLNAYANHPERGVIQIGDRIAKIASHNREHAAQLREMAQVAQLRSASEHYEEDQP
ncbi:MAG: DinB family protein [Dehalococcoidia bacterium]